MLSAVNCSDNSASPISSPTPRLLHSRCSHPYSQTRARCGFRLGGTPAEDGSRAVPQALKMDCVSKVAFLERILSAVWPPDSWRHSLSNREGCEVARHRRND